ncbi:MAG TPA: hypothetical protein VGS80_10765, partial [Ktedonobacterales bacterium]|nr:hypothetical protein [Ktedonobacterales bacterium]
MPLTLRGDARAALETAPARSRTVRHWRRYQAVWLRADGVPVASVAQTVDWTETSSSNWGAAWRAAGAPVSRRACIPARCVGSTQRQRRHW